MIRLIFLHGEYYEKGSFVRGIDCLRRHGWVLAGGGAVFTFKTAVLPDGYVV